jgi:Big-like domain-containing protein
MDHTTDRESHGRARTRVGLFSSLRPRLRPVTRVAFLVAFSALMIVPQVATANHAPYVIGEVFAGDSGGLIKRYLPTGTFVEDLNTTTNASFETGMCFGEGGNLRTTNFDDDSVSLFNNMGGLLDATWGSGFNSHPESCVLDAAGDIYVGHADGNQDILKFDTSGALLASYNVATDARGSDWIDLAADQCTMYYTSEGPNILRYNVCTDTQLTNFATNFTDPLAATDCYALRIRPNGDVMVACHDRVYRLSSTGTVLQRYLASDYGEDYFFALNLDPDTLSFWTAGIFSGNVYRINILTGLQITTFNAAPGGIFGLAIFGEITVAQPGRLTLSPKTATNPVHTQHCVTATVTTIGGQPAEDVLVRFRVTGSVNTTGSATTNASGQAEFCYTGPTSPGVDEIHAYADTDKDNFQDPGEPFDDAAKTWIAGAPAKLDLQPKVATNPVDTRHCVTATVTDEFGNPVPGVTVRFRVTGSVNTSGSATTNANGQATFCYNGPPLPGADEIHAYADTDNDNVQDATEPFDDATKAWVLPVTTPNCEIKINNGGWIIAANADRGSFGGMAKADEASNVTGNEQYQDHGPVRPFNLHGDPTVVTCDSSTSATIYGTATIDGAGSFTFRIRVEDNGEGGKGVDKYWIIVSNGYDSGNQTLKGGNVQIHRG